MKELIIKSVGRLLNLGSWIFPGYTRELAARILSRVTPLPRTEAGTAFINSGTTSWLDVDGVRTALHQWGNGPSTVLFLHGWMSSSPRWKSLIESLDPELYTAYALDAPGHGYSEGRSLNLEIYRRAYTEALGQTGPVDVLVGHSLGNLVAAYQFLYQPQVAVKSYVIMGSPSGMEAIFGYFVDILSLSPRMVANVRKKVDEILKIPHSQLSMRAFFQKNDRPKLVVHDRQDAITPITPIQKAIEGQENVRHFFTSGLEHTLKAPEVDRRILEFIELTTQTAHSYVSKEV